MSDKTKTKKDNGRTKKYKYSTELVIEAIKESGGIITTICTRLNCDRNTFYGYLKSREEIRDAYEEEKEAVLDMAESALFTQIANGEFNATCFFLKCKGKDRGYVEKQEVDLNHTTPPKLEVVLNAPGITS